MFLKKRFWLRTASEDGLLTQASHSPGYFLEGLLKCPRREALGRSSVPRRKARGRGLLHRLLTRLVGCCSASYLEGLADVTILRTLRYLRAPNADPPRTASSRTRRSRCCGDDETNTPSNAPCRRLPLGRTWQGRTVFVGRPVSLRTPWLPRRETSWTPRPT
jgi:hypothetical protein